MSQTILVCGVGGVFHTCNEELTDNAGKKGDAEFMLVIVFMIVLVAIIAVSGCFATFCVIVGSRADKNYQELSNIKHEIPPPSPRV